MSSTTGLPPAAPSMPPAPLIGTADDLLRAEQRRGVLYGLAAYGAWGLIPIYFKWLSHVPPLEMLAHRVVWSVFLLGGWLHLRRQWPAVRAALSRRRTLLTMLGTTVLIGTNWGLFIYAIVAQQLLQASLGYFINPLVNMMLGCVFLGERLAGRQWLCVGLAAGGVAVITAQAGGLPLLALALAFSFGLYGLLRKTAPVEPIGGLFIETALLTPAGVAYLVYYGLHDQLAFLHGAPSADVGMLAGGVITALPLIWFTHAARRLRLTTIGFLQYIAPTGQFLLAVAFGEAFTRQHALGFGLIWLALALYSLEALRRRGVARRDAGASAVPSAGRN